MKKSTILLAGVAIAASLLSAEVCARGGRGGLALEFAHINGRTTLFHASESEVPGSYR